MGEMDCPVELDVTASAGANGRGFPLAHAIDRQNRRLVEGAAVERGSGVAEMMLREQDGALVSGERLADHLVDVDLLCQKGRQTVNEVRQAEGPDRHGRLDYSVQLQNRFFVKNNCVN